MAEPIYIFAGGGTGGHLLPALAVAERLLEMRPAAKIVFACSERAMDRRILSPTAYAVVPQPIRPLPRSPRGWWRFLSGWSRAGRLARHLIRDLRPAAVFGLGGFAAVPVTRAAAARGVRTCLLSIDALPGLANRYLARRVDVIFAQFEPTVEAYGARGAKARVVGLPVQAALAGAERTGARKHLGLRVRRRTLLVMAGSQGAANINRALAALRGELVALGKSWQILHLAGPGKLQEVQADWQNAAVHHVTMEFCERMDLAYAAADLALCRAGAATVGELTATATPAVLMPYPYHRDQHQRHNAAAPVAAGAAVMVADACEPQANAEALRSSLLEIMRDPGRLKTMRDAAGRSSRPDAAAEIARWLAG